MLNIWVDPFPSPPVCHMSNEAPNPNSCSKPTPSSSILRSDTGKDGMVQVASSDRSQLVRVVMLTRDVSLTTISISLFRSKALEPHNLFAQCCKALPCILKHVAPVQHPKSAAQRRKKKHGKISPRQPPPVALRSFSRHSLKEGLCVEVKSHPFASARKRSDRITSQSKNKKSCSTTDPSRESPDMTNTPLYVKDTWHAAVHHCQWPQQLGS